MPSDVETNAAGAPWVTELRIEKEDGTELTMLVRRGCWKVQQLVRRFMGHVIGSGASLKQLQDGVVSELKLSESIDMSLYEFLTFVVSGSKVRAYTLNGIRTVVRDDLPKRYDACSCFGGEFSVRMHSIGSVYRLDDGNIVISYGMPGDPGLPDETAKSFDVADCAPATICNHCIHCRWEERGDIIESKCTCSGESVTVDAYKQRKCPNWKMKDMVVSKQGAARAAGSVREIPSSKRIIRTREKGIVGNLGDMEVPKSKTCGNCGYISETDVCSCCSACEPNRVVSRSANACEKWIPKREGTGDSAASAMSRRLLESNND